MKRLTIYGLAGIVSCCFGLSGPAVADGLRAWGSNSGNQVSALPPGTDYVAIAAGDAHALALRSDGTVAAWGQNASGQCTVPPGVYSAIGAGVNFSLGIRTDGSIVAWGGNAHKQVSGVPSGSGFASVKGGKAFAVALRRNGSIMAWGDDSYGQVSLAPPAGNFTAIAAGEAHALALRSDGRVVSWGNPLATAGAPTDATFTAISAGGNQCLAIRSDGSIAWWGDDRYGYGLANVPTGTDYASVVAGFLHAAALKKDGSVVGWGAGKDTSGHPNWGQADPPAGRDYTGLACGQYFSLALTSNAPKPVLADDFDDNSLGGSWRVVADNPTNCHLEEVRQRLELTAGIGANQISAFYLSNGWGLDATKDFSFRVDYHYAVAAKEDGGVAVLLTTGESDLHTKYLRFGAGAGVSYPYFWHEVADGGIRRTSFARRAQDDGSLYVSYDAKQNALYLGSTGYGSANAMVTTTPLSRGGGSGQVLLVGLGGASNHEAIEPGKACLDNFRLDSGVVVLTGMMSVYRFWSPATGKHFYTTSEAEKDVLVNEYSRTWTFEGVAFRVVKEASLPGMAPVHKFWVKNGQTQFYTISETEKARLLDQYAGTYRYDGVAFYAYPLGRQPSEARAVHRFVGLGDSGHLYTASEDEANSLRSNFSHVFTYEGIAFYAYE